MHVLTHTVVVFSLVCGAEEADRSPILFPDDPLFGVVVHTPFRVEALKKLHARWVRVNLRWHSVEHAECGVYDWSETDRLLKYYLDEGFRVLAILTCEEICPLYESVKEDKERVIQAIVRWAGAAAARYAGKGIVWELGNEPEVFPMGGYWDDPVTYARMARWAAAEIKKADPSALVAALSVAWMDREFILRSFEEGLLQDGNIDIVGYHGYHRENIFPESGLAADVRWLRNAAAKYAPQNKTVIVADTERGYAIEPFLSPKHWAEWRNIVYSDAEQAAYCARHYLETIALGVEIGVWYKDMAGERSFALYSGTDRDESGLRPAGWVYRNLAALFTQNPKKLVNDRYSVVCLGQPPTCSVVSRSYRDAGSGHERLIIAAWLPVEAFEGRILDSRKQIGEHFYEAWRAVSPEDVTECLIGFLIENLDIGRVVSARLYDLLAKEESALWMPVPRIEPEGSGVRLSDIRVAPMPVVVVLDLKGEE